MCVFCFVKSGRKKHQFNVYILLYMRSEHGRYRRYSLVATSQSANKMGQFLSADLEMRICNFLAKEKQYEWFCLCAIRISELFSERELSVIAMLSPVCLSSVYNARAPYTQPVEIFSNVSSPFGTLVTRWHWRKFLQRSSQGNPFGGRVKRKFGMFRGTLRQSGLKAYLNFQFQRRRISSKHRL